MLQNKGLDCCLCYPHETGHFSIKPENMFIFVICIAIALIDCLLRQSGGLKLPIMPLKLRIIREDCFGDNHVIGYQSEGGIWAKIQGYFLVGCSLINRMGRVKASGPHATTATTEKKILDFTFYHTVFFPLAYTHSPFKGPGPPVENHWVKPSIYLMI